MDRAVIYYLWLEGDDLLRDQYRKLERMRTAMPLLQELNKADTRLFIDEGVEAPLRERPQMKEILEQVARKNVSALIVNSVYSLGDDLAENFALLAFFRQQGVRVICIDNHIDSDLLSPESCALLLERPV